jgi:hypothetical protein
MCNFLVKLGFTEAASSALVDHQGLDNQVKLVKYDDDLIEGTCKAVRKPSSGQDGHQIPEIVAHRLQLAAYFAKHRERTQHVLNVRVTDLNALLSLKDQRIMEKNWTKQNPEHKPDAVVLDAQRAVMAFDQAVTVLQCLRGVTGITLLYVVCHKIFPYQDDDDGDIPCGLANSKYQTIDEELEARAPILNYVAGWED